MQPSWQTPSSRTSGPFFPGWPSAVACLLAAQAVGLLAQFALRVIDGGADPVFAAGALSAEGLRAGRFWQPLTHLFLVPAAPPAALWLLPISALALGLAGRPLEAILGRRHVLQLYTLAGMAGGVAQAGFDRLPGMTDLPLAGAPAPALAVCLATACVLPGSSPLPVWRGLRAGPLALVTVGGLAALGWCDPHGRFAGPLAMRCLVGGLVGCLYMRCLGFGGRVRLEKPRPAAPPAASAARASWSEAGQPSPSGVLTAPAPAATGARVVPRFTERERRMTPRQYVIEKIDPILDKILVHGLSSLTDDERRILQKGREKIAQGR